MNTSESITKISAALLKAQKQITFAVKDSTNPAYRSKYADLSSVIEACKPALNDAGISFIQMPAPSDGDTLALTTRLLHESGEWIESTATCPLQKHDPQGYGSANTYLRRYCLAAAVGLYQDDDDGEGAKNTPGKPKPVNERLRDVKGINPRAGAAEALTREQIQFLDSAAAYILECFENNEQLTAIAFYNKERPTDSDEQVYLWDQLPSNVRSVLNANKESK